MSGSSIQSARARFTGALGGVLLVLAASGILMGITTGEALYPAVYTTHDNEISDLGATRPPDSIILQPSATIFNVTMMVAGVAIMAGAWLTYLGQRSRRALVAVGLLGFGALGVGVFPGNNAGFHPLFALLTFVSGGIAAILVAPLLATPFRYVSVGLGVTSLMSLGVGIFGTGSRARSSATGAWSAGSPTRSSRGWWRTAATSPAGSRHQKRRPSQRKRPAERGVLSSE